MQAGPAIYVGALRHRRFRPVGHAFTYPVFMVMLDIDRIPEMMRVSRFSSYNRWNWAGYNECDHFGDAPRGIITWMASGPAGRLLPTI